MKRFFLFLLIFLSCVVNAKDSIKHELNGKASYYGSQYKETRLTANGEKFNKNNYTGAHKTLPFGTIVKVTNKKNNKTIKVRINDRGPFVKGRVIDITPIAAKELDFIKDGIAEVELEVVNHPTNKR